MDVFWGHKGTQRDELTEELPVLVRGNQFQDGMARVSGGWAEKVGGLRRVNWRCLWSSTVEETIKDSLDGWGSVIFIGFVSSTGETFLLNSTSKLFQPWCKFNLSLPIPSPWPQRKFCKMSLLPSVNNKTNRYRMMIFAPFLLFLHVMLPCTSLHFSVTRDSSRNTVQLLDRQRLKIQGLSNRQVVPTFNSSPALASTGWQTGNSPCQEKA